MLNRIILFFALSFLYHSLLAQQKIDWVKYDTLLFKKEMSQNMSENFEIRNHIIYPINESPAKIEIRLYFLNILAGNSGTIKTIKLYADTDSAICEDYLFKYYHWRYGDSDKFEFIGKLRNGQDIVRYKKKHVEKISGDTILNLLMSNNAFSLPDNIQFLDSLKKQKIHFNDPCEGTTDCSSLGIFELKFGNKYRNIFINMADYSVVNKHIKEFQQYSKIISLFCNKNNKDL